MYRFLVAMVLCGLTPTTTHAHDFWIEPSALAPKPGQLVKLHLRVGEKLEGEAVTRNPKRIVRFIVADDAGEKPVVGRDGLDPAGLFRFEKPGAFIVAYESNRASVELDAAKFEQYLREEGLERIAALRAERGETGKPVREVYTRHCKSLINVGAIAQAAAADRALGLPFEIVADGNPAALTAGGKLTVRVLYRGKPLEGALVCGVNKKSLERRPTARTDKDGRATLTLPESGFWMIKCVHMEPAPQDGDADWESYWASLTFEL